MKNAVLGLLTLVFVSGCGGTKNFTSNTFLPAANSSGGTTSQTGGGLTGGNSASTQIINQFGLSNGQTVRLGSLGALAYTNAGFTGSLPVVLPASLSQSVYRQRIEEALGEWNQATQTPVEGSSALPGLPFSLSARALSQAEGTINLVFIVEPIIQIVNRLNEANSRPAVTQVEKVFLPLTGDLATITLYQGWNNAGQAERTAILIEEIGHALLPGGETTPSWRWDQVGGTTRGVVPPALAEAIRRVYSAEPGARLSP